MDNVNADCVVFLRLKRYPFAESLWFGQLVKRFFCQISD